MPPHSSPSWAACLLFLTSASAFGQNWAAELFAERQHDFGIVTRNAKSEYDFQFVNRLNRPLQVHSVGSSCGCVTPSIDQRTLQPGEQAAVHCRFNTHSFTGKRAAEVTVRFSSPQWAEVKLKITGVIRGDIFFDPSELTFGEIEQNAELAKKKVTIVQQGIDGWRIDDIKSVYRFVKVGLVETSRGRGFANYEMSVEFKPEAPPGYVSDSLIICASRPNGSRARVEERIPLAFSARIAAGIEISPSVARFGPLAPDQSASTKIILKSKTAFTIRDVVCTDANFSVKVNESPNGRLHILDLSYTARQISPGEISNSIKILTDLAANPEIDLPVVVTIQSEE